MPTGHVLELARAFRLHGASSSTTANPAARVGATNRNRPDATIARTPGGSALPADHRLGSGQAPLIPGNLGLFHSHSLEDKHQKSDGAANARAAWSGDRHV